MDEKLKQKKMVVYVDIGSHGKVFEFIAGPVANHYPSLLQVYKRQVTQDLKPAVLTWWIKEEK